MKLSKRLQAICDLVPENSNVIDVGANHALVDLYLTKYKSCKCLATEISENAMETGIKNIQNLKIDVTVKITKGLNGINIKDEIIIITGMGIHTILDILNVNIKNDLIISSTNTPGDLRKKLQKRGYRIYKELIVKEKKLYVITYYKYKNGKKINPYVSPYLTENIDYMKNLFKFYHIKSVKEKNLFKKMKYKRIVNNIKKITN